MQTHSSSPFHQSAPSPSSGKARQIFFYGLTLATILLTIVNSWGVVRYLHKTPLSKPVSFSEKALDLPDQLFLVQSRLVLGSDFFLSDPELAKQFKLDSENANLIRKQVKDSFHAGGFEALLAGGTSVTKLSRKALRNRIVIGNYYSYDTSRYLSELQQRHQRKPVLVDKILIERVLGDKARINDQEIDHLENELGWVGKLLLFSTETIPKKKELYKNKLKPETQGAFVKFLGALVFLFFFALLSILVCGSLMIYHHLKGFNFRFKPEAVPSNHLLEIFCVYLAIMLSGSLIIKALVHIAAIKPTMKLQVMVIAPSLLALLFPLLSGHRWPDILKQIGLKLDGARLFFRDILSTPLLYIGAWTPFFLLLVVYSLVLSWFNLDANESSHPIVPILTNSSDNSQIFFIIILAVVCAPIIEEIMFRGAFYGWLRTKFSYGASVLISALVFAAVHPQGPIGIFPLTMIGIFLAALREWRGNLIAPMIAHACVNAGTLAMVIFLFR